MTNVKAKCCGRWVPEDMLSDARAFPAEVRPNGAERLCDGCGARIWMEGRMTRAEMGRLQGRPPDLIAKLERMDRTFRPSRRGRRRRGTRS